MAFLIFVVFAAFVIYRIISAQKKRLLDQWQLAASSLPGFRCIPGGTVSGYPSLTGLIEGQRIDVAPFFHQEYGNHNTRMTGYRVRCDVPIELPGEAITSLTNHFQKFEIDDRRVFCATYGVEQSSSTLLAKIRKIESAIRLAGEQREQLARELLEKSKAEIDAIQMKKLKEDRELEKIPTIAQENSEPLSPTESPSPPPLSATEDPVEAAVFLPMEIDEDAAARDNAVEITTTEMAAETSEPKPKFAHQPASEPTTPPAVDPPAPRAPIGHDPLTAAALDLFAGGHNKFEITRLFDGEYSNREIEGQGTLQRIDTYSNDRTFGRGPGVVAEVEIALPKAPAPESDEDGDQIPSYRRAPRPDAVRLRVALPPVEGEPIGSQARELRKYIGNDVGLLGTLCRCDPFDTSLHLCDGVIG